MIILTIRTDNPRAEIGLFNNKTQLQYQVWEAHRELAETIHSKIDELLSQNSCKLSDVEGIIVYRGPGSFTGLRIGISVANAAAASINIPIVGIAGEDNWLEEGVERLMSGQSDKTVMPEYGAPVHITTPKK